MPIEAQINPKQTGNRHHLFALIVFLFGIWHIGIGVVQPDFSKIPGDLGDARFNNYILEHGYNFISGKAESFWDAPFMYPVKNATALSDNHLGTLPVYSLFRALGFDREASFQLWILAMFTLNFLASYYVFSKWTGNSLAAIAGAYIFTFSIASLQHLNHAQMLPRFMLPFFLYYFHNFITQLQYKYLIRAAISFVFLVYCGMYLGVLAFYSALFLIPASLICYYKDIPLMRFLNFRLLLTATSILVFSLLLLLPLSAYLKTDIPTGLKAYEDNLPLLPTLRSYFFSQTWSVTWKMLSEHGQTTIGPWWFHTHFPGGIPWLFVFISPILIIYLRSGVKSKQLMVFSILALVMNLLWFINFNGSSLYEYIYSLPGLKSIRSIDRVISIQIFFFAFITASGVSYISGNFKYGKALTIAAVLLIIGDNLTDTGWIRKFDKLEAQNRTTELKKTLKTESSESFEAVAYIKSGISDEDPFLYHLDGMIVAQDVGIPCINAYTGYFPDDYFGFYYVPDKFNLEAWCLSRSLDPEKILLFGHKNDITENKVIVRIKTPDGKFVKIGYDNQLTLFSSSNAEDSASVFSIVFLKEGKCVIRAENKKYLSAELGQSSEITANRTYVREWETFRLDTLSNETFAIKAYNEKYLQAAEPDGMLKAVSEPPYPLILIHVK